MTVNSQNKRDKIIQELETMIKKETVLNNLYKIRAYRKVVDQLRKLDKIYTYDDVKEVKGIGPKIKQKIEEILKTGKLESAERARKLVNIESYDELLKIHGIGINTAKELIELHNIKSISDLNERIKTNPDLLNDKQKIGLQYYNDIQLKIPRKEAEKHLRKLSKLIKTIDKSIDVKIVGSYRRGEEYSGDIDLILMINKNSSLEKKIKIFENAIQLLKDKKYLVADLASGRRKYSGICKLNKKAIARRIDILVTSPDEYPFALLYFTGDFDINVELRKRAGELGYNLNEYGLVSNNLPQPVLDSEKEIFNFLGYKYLYPKKRNISNLKKL